MRVMVIPIRLCALVTIPKRFEKYRRNLKSEKESRPSRLQHH